MKASLIFSIFLIAVVRSYRLKPSSVRTQDRNKRVSGVRDRSDCQPRRLPSLSLLYLARGSDTWDY